MQKRSWPNKGAKDFSENTTAPRLSGLKSPSLINGPPAKCSLRITKHKHAQSIWSIVWSEVK